MNKTISEAIILSSFVFGSMYLYSTTLKLINESYPYGYPREKIGPAAIDMINGITIGIAGSGIIMLFITSSF